MLGGVKPKISLLAKSLELQYYFCAFFRGSEVIKIVGLKHRNVVWMGQFVDVTTRQQ